VSRPQTLELVRADCEQLLQSVQSTAQLADHISGKVRQLDLVQGRVQVGMRRILKHRGASWSQCVLLLFCHGVELWAGMHRPLATCPGGNSRCSAR
jgi:hypothetical protein